MDTTVRDDTAYDQDFYAWTQEQAARLRAAAAAGSNLPLDWEHLAEEIESVGRSDYLRLESHLATVIEHLLKLEYSSAPYPRAGWVRSVRHARHQAVRALKGSPSLRPRLAEAVEEAWFSALNSAYDGLKVDEVPADTLPDTCPYPVERVLDDGWYPLNRHGLS